MQIDFLTPSAEFQTSVNIGYDLNNIKKVENFIPTTEAVALLEKLMLSTADSSTDRAHVLIGAYGKGKSHIVLSILSILCHKDRESARRFLAKVKDVNESLYSYCDDYLASNKKLLPVIISGNSASLTQAFLRALYSALSERGMTSVMPETNYELALLKVEQWKKEYPAVYKALEKELIMPVTEFERALSVYDADAYTLFEKVYPKLTAGNEFNPFSGYDVVELYELACRNLAEYGYTGIFVVYDEFSKYLESSINKASINDIKMLQDFAEKCSRSGKTQLHLLLISHKELENYIDVLPKQKVDGWRGVSERFSHISMRNDYAQTYEVLGAAIQKKEKEWNQFTSAYVQTFEDNIKKYVASNLFADCTEEQINNLIYKCYPLHPITSFLLPRISEKVAQNERTLFTFVAGQDATSLPQLKLVCGKGIPYITPDSIYDYFAPLMRKEVYTSEVYKLYTLTNDVLSKVEGNLLASKIVKTVSVIYCVGQFNVLAPTVETISDIFVSEDITYEEVLKTIDELIDKHLVVYIKRSNSYLQLKKSSGVDIFSEINNTIEKRKTSVSMTQMLNNANVEPYLYPIRYNDEHAMTRFFRFCFVPINEIDSWLSSSENIADGIILGIVPDDATDAIPHADVARKFLGNKQTVVAFPSEVVNIDHELRVLDAVTLLRDAASEDEILKSEYDIIYRDVLEIVNRFIAQYIQPALHGVEYWYAGEKQKIYRKSHLTELLSQICDDVFPYTPTINNEVINRNKITTVALNSRTKLITALLKKDLESNLGLSGSGQDVSFMRSTLLITGILSANDNGIALSEHTNDAMLDKVLQTIDGFLKSSLVNGKVCFRDLYDTLTQANSGIGMRKGVIPIYIAVVLHKYDDHFVIWHKDQEMKMSASLLNQINELPDEYFICLEEWTTVKEEYTVSLAKLFADNIVEKEKLYGTYAYLSMAMGRWYLSLPKFVKESAHIYSNKGITPIPKQLRSFLGVMRQSSIGAQELLFERIPKCFSCEEINTDLIIAIKSAKAFYDSFKFKLEEELAADVNSIFANDQRVGLSANINLWIDNLSEMTKNKIYNNGAERLLKSLLLIDNDEHKIINSLAKAITGLRIEDWNEDSIGKFLEGVKLFKSTIDDENIQNSKQPETREQDGFGDSYSVVFVDENGNSKQRVFERTECSKRAKLLHNMIKANLNDMGHSVTPEEKRQVLMDILETLC